jgi:hypothetical protein
MDEAKREETFKASPVHLPHNVTALIIMTALMGQRILAYRRKGFWHDT